MELKNPHIETAEDRGWKTSPTFRGPCKNGAVSPHMRSARVDLRAGIQKVFNDWHLLRSARVTRSQFRIEGFRVIGIARVQLEYESFRYQMPTSKVFVVK